MGIAASWQDKALILKLVTEAKILTLSSLLDRQRAMLTRRAHMGGRSTCLAPIGQRARER
jgi:hypothetical protein